MKFIKFLAVFLAFCLAVLIPSVSLAQSVSNPPGNGANVSGPYDPTPPTGDNQGNGNAPENGSVGNADDKNPPGQQPGGHDNNKGYECDENKGVGNDGGNPAHTGCANPTTAPTEKPTEQPKEKPTEKPSEKPTQAPTQKPTEKPTHGPTQEPTADPVSPKPTDKPKNEKVTICHATGSEKNPYVVITVDKNGLNGHGDHEGDIIPAPANGCPKPAVVTPSPVVTTPPASKPPVTPVADCPVSAVGTFANASGNKAVLTVTVNGKVTPFGLTAVHGAPLPGVFEVHETDFEFPGLVHLLNLEVGDVVSLSITDGRITDTSTGVVRQSCYVGVEVGLEKFVGPVVPKPVPPVKTVTPIQPVPENPTLVKPTPAFVGPQAPQVVTQQSDTATVNALPVTGARVGTVILVGLGLLLLGFLLVGLTRRR